MRKKLVFLILDGLGEGEQNISNPFRFVQTKNFDYFKKFYPFCLLNASGVSVGLLKDEPGNCEIGHLTIGTGIIYYENYPKITLAIENGEFFKNERALKIFSHCRQYNSRLHLVGLLSEGKNISDINHLLALLDFAKRENCQVYLHLFTDGLDSKPKSAAELLEKLQKKIKEKKYPAKIASLCGRFYALDQTGDYLLKTQRVFLLITQGIGREINDPIKFLKEKYQDPDFNDNLLEPVILEKDGILKDNDALLFFHFENKTIFQLANSFLNQEFKEFERPERKNILMASLTRYFEDIDYLVIFETQKIETNLSRILAENKINQIKLIDSSREKLFKYYFNGFFEEEHPLETYKIFPSFEKIDLESLMERTKEMVDSLKLIIQEEGFDFVLMNLPIFDIVGHSGNFPLAIKVIGEIDKILGDLYQIIQKTNYVLMITSDHGNIEKMIDTKTGQKDTYHNPNPVPFYLIDKEKRAEKTKEEIYFFNKKILGSLVDIAPTILEIFEIKIPKEFEGKSLLRLF